MTFESLAKKIGRKDVDADYVRDEFLNLAVDFQTIDRERLNESAYQHGYTVSDNRGMKVNLIPKKEKPIFSIVYYKVLGKTLGFVEPLIFNLESSPQEFKVTSDLLNTEMGRSVWMTQRHLYPDMASCCTRQLPFIAMMSLAYNYGVKDGRIRCEAARKLLSFGTKHFGEKEFDIPWWETPSSFNWVTPYGVLLSPGEMDAIMQTTWQMVEESGSLEKLEQYDMRRFAENLKKKAGIIAPSLDLAVYGRNVYNCGLTNYKCAVSFNERSIDQKHVIPVGAKRII